jgi:hypothetical protein
LARRKAPARSSDRELPDCVFRRATPHASRCEAVRNFVMR